jgi:hypothetical protein
MVRVAVFFEHQQLLLCDFHIIRSLKKALEGCHFLLNAKVQRGVCDRSYQQTWNCMTKPFSTYVNGASTCSVNPLMWVSTEPQWQYHEQNLYKTTVTIYCALL